MKSLIGQTGSIKGEYGKYVITDVITSRKPGIDYGKQYYEIATCGADGTPGCVRVRKAVELFRID